MILRLAVVMSSGVTGAKEGEATGEGVDGNHLERQQGSRVGCGHEPQRQRHIHADALGDSSRPNHDER